MVSPGRKNSDILGSRFPNIIPILNGKSTEINEMIGKIVPINPNEIKVNNGPSLIASMDRPPTSERFP